MAASTENVAAAVALEEKRVSALSFEERYLATGQVKNAAVREFLSVPEGDIVITQTPLPLRTTETTVPAEEQKKTQPNHIQDCIYAFTQDIKEVKFQHRSLGPERKLEIPSPNLQKLKYDRDMPTDSSSEVVVDEELLSQYTADIYKAEHAARQAGRVPLMAVADITKVQPPLAKAMSIPKTITYSDSQVLVKYVDLRSSLGDMEPFFVSMALFDVAKKQRITEDFQCTNADLALLQRLSGRKTPLKSHTFGTTANFRVSEPSPSVQLVIRIEKVLMGDEATAMSLYFKPSVKPKEKTKYAASLAAAFSRVGAFTQTFALGIVPLFDANGDCIYRSLASIDVKRLVRMGGDFSDDALYRSLKALTAEKEPSKLKPVPVKLVLEVGPTPADLPCSVDPTLVPIAPQPGEVADKAVVREIQEFHLEDTGIAPHSNWVHHLYVYPLSVNLSNWTGKGKARNLCVEVFFKDNDSSSISASPDMIYGSACEADLVGFASSQTSYHDPKPNFHLEVKLRLPGAVTEQHHILVVVNHVQVTPKSKKDKGENVKTPVAYAVLPLLDKEKKFLADGEHFLNATYNLPNNYMSPSAEDTMKLVDKNRKPNVIMRTKLISTIMSQDEQLAQFFQCWNSCKDDSKLWASVTALRTLSPPLSIKWFPTLFTAFFKMLCNMKTNASLCALQTMVFLVDSVNRLQEGQESSENNVLLQWYIQYRFDVVQGRVPLHEALVSTMADVLQQKNAEVTEIMCKHSWFVFEMIIKSMALYLSSSGYLSESVPRRSRLPPEYAHQIARLMAFVLDEMINKPVIARAVNKAAAKFLVALLGLMDRGVVMDLVYLYAMKMPDHMIDMRFAFLNEIVAYEHYVQLNLPLPDRIESIPNLERVLWEKHFLSGLLCHEVCRVIGQGQAAPTNLAITTLFNLLLRHETDVRYQNAMAQKCIAGIYFPFILRMSDIQTEQPTLLSSAPFEVRRKILMCFVWVARNIQRKFLQQWWVQDTQRRVISFFVLLANASISFEYRISYKDVEGKEELLKSRSNATKTDLTTQDPMATLRRGTHTPIMLRKQESTFGDGDLLPRLKEMNLVREINITIADLLMDFMNDFAADLKTPSNDFMDRIVISLPLIMLRIPQSEETLCSLLSLLRHIIVMFPEPLFKHATPFCGDITYELMRHCNSNSQIIRSKVCAVLYLLLKQNYVLSGNISRMRLQSTIGVNKLVGEGLTQKAGKFTACLKVIAKYSVADAQIDRAFKTQVVDLAKRLLTVLSNSTMINQFSYDTEMTADLYYEISKGYVASPDLRAAWLASLAKLHLAHENYEEVAQCKIHLASLISVYINELKPTERVVVNKRQFQRAAPNSKAEMDVPPEAFEEEGICESSTFTRDGLFAQLAEAVEFLKKDSLFESCIAVERLIVDIHKENRSFGDISKVFLDLEKLCMEIINANATNSRLFSQYYLVGFYGDVFADQNRKEYIYKERPHVRVAEFTDRMVEQYTSKFGSCNVFKGSLPAESDIDFSVPNIRVLSIKPYLTNEELAKRSTTFERQFNINTFIYETPMTTSGKKYSEDMREQQKKKTLLTTQFAFPYVIKRLPVLHERHSILTPIQTSTEIISERCQALKLEIQASPPNSKTLQIILQGSVLLQVNAGPLAIGKTFLSEKDKYDAEDVELLETYMAEFVDLCGQALKLNKTIIDASQSLFHEEMEKGYAELVHQINVLLGIRK